jgi:hypothetical protein
MNDAGTLLLSASSDDTVRLWDMRQQRCIQVCARGSPRACVHVRVCVCVSMRAYTLVGTCVCTLQSVSISVCIATVRMQTRTRMRTECGWACAAATFSALATSAAAVQRGLARARPTLSPCWHAILPNSASQPTSGPHNQRLFAASYRSAPLPRAAPHHRLPPLWPAHLPSRPRNSPQPWLSTPSSHES